ncbi:MAG: hypothetical protein AABX77_02200 [Nanoarchaeota archaeon]
MEAIHIKLDYENALNSKKQILMSEANILRVLDKINSYKSLRKKELELKNKLRISLNGLAGEIDSIHNSLPSDSIPKIKNKITKKKESRESKNIKGELEEIKRKLERLRQVH